MIKNPTSLVYRKLTSIKHYLIYKQNSRRVCIKNADIAVHLHLFYPDMLEGILDKLANLDESYDLYVTVPRNKYTFLPNDFRENPSITIFTVPNRGRDVLPFLYVNSRIKDLEYDAILKIHTKKSPHFDGGNEWFDNTINSLTSIQVNSITSTFKDTPTIVGPAGFYTSLRVNFDANGVHMEEILSREFKRKNIEDVIQTNRAHHGFFGGTMFWIAPRYLQSEMFKCKISYFENEAGQVDGTYAHALERIFTLKAQMNNQPIFQIKSRKVLPVAYEDGSIPEWSELYAKS